MLAACRVTVVTHRRLARARHRDPVTTESSASHLDVMECRSRCPARECDGSSRSAPGAGWCRASAMQRSEALRLARRKREGCSRRSRNGDIPEAEPTDAAFNRPDRSIASDSRRNDSVAPCASITRRPAEREARAAGQKMCRQIDGTILLTFRRWTRTEHPSWCRLRPSPVHRWHHMSCRKPWRVPHMTFSGPVARRQ